MDPSSEASRSANVPEWTSEEYECQFFTFHRRLFIECLRAMVEEQIDRQVRGAQDDLTEALGLSGESLLAVTAKLNRVSNFLRRNADEPLLRIRQEIDECFRIPDELTLPEDKDYGATTEEQFRAIERMEAARNRALSAAAAGRLLKRELTAVRAPSLQNSVQAAQHAAENLAASVNSTSIAPSLLLRHAHIFRQS